MSETLSAALAIVERHIVLHANQSLPDFLDWAYWTIIESDIRQLASVVSCSMQSSERDPTVDRTPAYGGTPGTATNSLTGNSPNPVNAGAEAAAVAAHKVESAAAAAHKATDRIADTAAAQVDRLSGTAHRAVNSAADAATSAAQWASTVPQQVQQVQARLTESACASIRAKPLQTVAGALAIGFLLGRLLRR
jgi:ElaB/YqjD/DUF883 family membrane-anchored ribosome-binding protein